MKDSIKPVVRSKDTPIPKMSVGRTEALVYNQGITYNETGLTYNEAGYAYGGLYGYDFAPMISRARNIIPSIKFARDFSGTTPAVRTLGKGMLVGMLGMTYPEDISILA